MSYIKLEDDYEPPSFEFKKPWQTEFVPVVKPNEIFDSTNNQPPSHLPPSTSTLNPRDPFEFDPFQNSDPFSSNNTSLENEKFNLNDSFPNQTSPEKSSIIPISAYPTPLSTIECTISMKLCTFGFVSSKKWYSVYLVIDNFYVRIFESREAYHSTSPVEITNIRVDKYTHTSPVNPKTYNNITFYTFYIQYDNGAFMPTKLLKIGCVTRPQAEMIKDGVRFYRNN